jgi:hypothetical protein
MKMGRLTLPIASIATVATILAAGMTPIAASAATPARTTVSVAPYPDGFVGFVSSPAPRRCAANREVVLMRQVGGAPNPARDKLIARAVARSKNRHYVWSVRDTSAARVYAVVSSEPGCGAARSKTTEVLPRGSDALCPSEEPVCRLAQIHFDATAYCPNFGDRFAICLGTSTSDSVPWSQALLDLPGLAASFSWEGQPRKLLNYSVVQLGIPVAQLLGSVPDPASPNFSVSLAYALEWPHPAVRWITPDLPGMHAGEPGGPLSIDFKNGRVGIDVYIKGYLYRVN